MSWKNESHPLMTLLRSWTRFSDVGILESHGVSNLWIVYSWLLQLFAYKPNNGNLHDDTSKTKLYNDASLRNRAQRPTMRPHSMKTIQDTCLRYWWLYYKSITKAKSKKKQQHQSYSQNRKRLKRDWERRQAELLIRFVNVDGLLKQIRFLHP